MSAGPIQPSDGGHVPDDELPPAERSRVSVYEAKTHLSRLLERAAAGERIVVTKHGQPIAEILAPESQRPMRKPGAWKGRIWVSPDFDEFTEQDERDWYGE